MTGDRNRSRARTRRAVLGSFAAATTTAVAGCGYRGAIGDPLWRTDVNDDADRDPLVLDDAVFWYSRGTNELFTEPGRVLVSAVRDGRTRKATELWLLEGLAAVSGDAMHFSTTPRGNERLQALTSVDATGRIWANDVDSPAVAVAAGPDTVYAVTARGVVRGFDDQGESRFATECSCLDGVATSVAAAADATGCAVLSGGTSRELAAFASDGDERWRTGPRFGANATVTVVDGVAYVADAGLTAFDLASGDDLSLPVAPDAVASIVPAGDRAYVVADGRLHAVDARTGGVAWRFPADDGLLGSPTVTGRPVPVGEAVIVGTDGRTVELDAADGGVRWRRAFPENRVLGAQGDAVALRAEHELVVRRRR